MSLLRKRSSAPQPAEEIGGPLVWTFDGAFSTCLADMEDALRRAIVQVGDISSIAVLIELSLPGLQRRIDTGDVLQPAWSRFLEQLSERYGLPSPARIRALDREGPLVTLVIAYRG